MMWWGLALVGLIGIVWSVRSLFVDDDSFAMLVLVSAFTLALFGALNAIHGL